MDKTVFSEVPKVRCGMIQGDIISSILFILTLDQIMQRVDKTDKGVKSGWIFRIKTLGYADDICSVRFIELLPINNLHLSTYVISVNCKLNKSFLQHRQHRPFCY